MTAEEQHFQGPEPPAAIDWRELAARRGRRNARLERELLHVRAERARLERLLATAVQLLAPRDSTQPMVMLALVAAITGDRLDRPAYVDDEQKAVR